MPAGGTGAFVWAAARCTVNGDPALPAPRVKFAACGTRAHSTQGGKSQRQRLCRRVLLLQGIIGTDSAFVPVHSRHRGHRHAKLGSHISYYCHHRRYLRFQWCRRHRYQYCLDSVCRRPDSGHHFRADGTWARSMSVRQRCSISGAALLFQPSLPLISFFSTSFVSITSSSRRTAYHQIRHQWQMV